MGERPGREGDDRSQKDLRELLLDNVAQLQNDTLRSHGAVPSDQLESLERLARLIRAADEARTAPVRSHWPIVALFAASLLIVSVLLFTGPRTAEIELDLRVDQLSFALTQRQVLSGALQLASLGLTGIGEVSLPRTENADAKTLLAGRDFGSTVAVGVLPRGELTLPDLVLPALSKVVVEKSDSPLAYRLTVPATDATVSVNANGPQTVSVVGGRELPLELLSPKSVVFKPQAAQVTLDLTFPAPPPKMLSTPLAVRDLSLVRIEDRPGIEGLPARRVSTIRAGTVYFEDLNGKKLTLRPGEVIVLDGSQGEIESLQLKDDIVLQFRGQVHGILSGPADIRRSLMPTWLEWLKARQGLSLLWGSALYLFGLVTGVLRWLRGSE